LGFDTVWMITCCW